MIKVSQVRLTKADLRAVGLECPSQAAAWMSRTCEVVIGLGRVAEFQVH